MPKSRDLDIDKTIFDVVGNTRRPKLEPETGWYKVGPSEPIGVNFTNSWVSSTSADKATPSWYLSEDGEVRLRGGIYRATGITGSVVFQLPEEVRPEFSETFIVPVDSDGNIDLSGIKFRAYEAGDA